MKAQIYLNESIGTFPHTTLDSALTMKINPDTITFENQSDVQATLEKLFSAKFRFMSNGTIHADGKFINGLTVHEHYKKNYNHIPAQDIIVVPHAFYGSYRNRAVFGSTIKDCSFDDDIPLKSGEGETSISIWIKEHPKPVEKKNKVKKLYRCPACGDTLTQEEYIESLASGGSGYCSCRFSAKDTDGSTWYPRECVEYEVFTREEN